MGAMGVMGAMGIGAIGAIGGITQGCMEGTKAYHGAPGLQVFQWQKKRGKFHHVEKPTGMFMFFL
jgi:hypothetical protein